MGNPGGSTLRAEYRLRPVAATRHTRRSPSSRRVRRSAGPVRAPAANRVPSRSVTTMKPLMAPLWDRLPLRIKGRYVQYVARSRSGAARRRAGMESWNREAVAAILQECGAIALQHYARPRVALKSDQSLVTDADHAIEAHLARLFDRPEEGSYLIGEETVGSRSEEYVQEALRARAWVVDPIDGTAPYAHHLPTWAISIGLMEGGTLTEGAVYLPITRELLVSRGPSVSYGTMPAEGALEIAWEEIGGARTGGPALHSAVPSSVHRYTTSGLIGITQGMAKRGRVDLPNPVQVLCTAVMSLAMLCLGRYLGYIGRLKLWDLAGGLPLLLKCGMTARLHEGPALGPEVSPELYDLRPDSDRRWRLRAPAVFALSEDIADRLDAALVRG